MHENPRNRDECAHELTELLDCGVPIGFFVDFLGSLNPPIPFAQLVSLHPEEGERASARAARIALALRSLPSLVSPAWITALEIAEQYHRAASDPGRLDPWVLNVRPPLSLLDRLLQVAEHRSIPALFDDSPYLAALARHYRALHAPGVSTFEVEVFEARLRAAGIPPLHLLIMSSEEAA